MILFHRNIKIHQSRYSLLLMSSFSSFKALVFLLLAEYHLKRIVNEPTIRNSYQFPNVKVMNGIIEKLMMAQQL